MEHTFVIECLGLHMQWCVTKAELDVLFVLAVLGRTVVIHVTANIYKVRHVLIILILSSYFPRANK